MSNPDETLTREPLDQLAAAMIAVQSEIKPAPESGRNPHLKTRYSTLEDIWSVCRGPLARHGLTVIQAPQGAEEGWLSLETILLHKSGQRISSVIRVPVGKHDIQAFGGALTYARRYALAAMIGVTSGEDDDGESAKGLPAQQPPERQSGPEARPEAESRSDRQAARVGAPDATAGQSLICTGAECGKSLTKGQHDVSVRAFGKPLCPACQVKAGRAVP
jgi:hypothetical protein